MKNEDMRVHMKVPISQNGEFQMPPSKKLLRRQGSLILGEEPSKASTGGYKGNPRTGIRGLADQLNCALWLTNLPPDCKEWEVLSVVDTGAVIACKITRPQGTFVKAAAKLGFKHPEAAARFIRRCSGLGRIMIRDHTVRVAYNEWGCIRYRNKKRTRVLSIEGPAEHVDYDDRKGYFDCFCDYEMSGWQRASSEIPGYRVLIWEFARINGQATQCLNGLMCHPVYGEFLTVKFAPDPCGRFYP